MSTESLFRYYANPEGQRFLARQALWLALAALALHALFGYSDVDRAVARLFFDPSRNAFPLTNAWLLKSVLHDAVRDLAAALGLAVMAATLLAWAPGGLVPRLRAHRQALAFTSLALIVGPAAVGTLKGWSGHACPWSLADFGGAASYAHLFRGSLTAPMADGCFPAAHPLAGYAWLALGLTLQPTSARRARLAWRAALAVGTALGLVQIARGAHFPSHVLWSAWVVWAVDVTLIAALARAARRAPAAAVARPASAAPAG